LALHPAHSKPPRARASAPQDIDYPAKLAQRRQLPQGGAAVEAGVEGEGGAASSQLAEETRALLANSKEGAGQQVRVEINQCGIASVQGPACTPAHPCIRTKGLGGPQVALPEAMGSTVAWWACDAHRLCRLVAHAPPPSNGCVTRIASAGLKRTPPRPAMGV